MSCIGMIVALWDSLLETSYNRSENMFSKQVHEWIHRIEVGGKGRKQIHDQIKGRGTREASTRVKEVRVMLFR